MEIQEDTSSSIGDPDKVNHPKPTDFDNFLPWACKKLSIETDVIVTRAAQKSYVSASAKNKKMSLKPKKAPSLVVSPQSLADDVTSVHDDLLNTDENIILIETVYDINENLVQLKFLKNKAIPRKIMQTIALAIPFQPHLTSIIINSGLRMDSLYEISKFLPNSHITELCLDSTFLSQANYHILLTDSKIKHFSLAKCTINDAIVKTIADQLRDPCPASKVLSALNLSSNKITDVGAKYLADMLRTNRQLCYLNVADNMITDEGGMRILDTLQKFPLHDQELLESRARYVTYIKKRTDLVNTLITELQTEAFNKNANRKKSIKKAKLEKESLQNCPLQKSLIDDDEAQILQEKAEYLAASRMGLFNEAFSPNNTKSHDGVVHCFGNNTLCYLNIAYNSLTYASVKKLHEVLSTQKSLNRIPRGLIKVVIEGNLMPIACKEYGEIDQLLKLGTSGLGATKKSEAPTKKTISSSKSVDN